MPNESSFTVEEIQAKLRKLKHASQRSGRVKGSYVCGSCGMTVEREIRCRICRESLCRDYCMKNGSICNECFENLGEGD